MPKHRFRRKRDQGWQNVGGAMMPLRGNLKVGMFRPKVCA
jgi:hypothetical protein